jgi:hypothetical protein
MKVLRTMLWAAGLDGYLAKVRCLFGFHDWEETKTDSQACGELWGIRVTWYGCKRCPARGVNRQGDRGWRWVRRTS